MYIMQNNENNDCWVFFTSTFPEASVKGVLSENNTCKVSKGTNVNDFNGAFRAEYTPNNTYARSENPPTAGKVACTSTTFDPSINLQDFPGFPFNNNGIITNAFSCVRK